MACVQYYLAKADAERRELYLKTTKGRRALKLMLPESRGEGQIFGFDKLASDESRPSGDTRYN